MDINPIDKLNEGSHAWNEWRKTLPEKKKIYVYAKNNNLLENNFTGANFSYCVFKGLNFSNCIFDGADFSCVDLRDTKIENTSFERTIFWKAKLGKMDLRKSVFREAIFRYADMEKTQLSNVDLTNADLSHANLTKAILSGAKLQDARFLNAVMRYVDLSKADATRADFDHADLHGAMLTDCKVDGANFHNAITTKTNADKKLIDNAFGAQFRRNTWYENVICSLFGEKIAVLGPSTVGKTTLHHFLQYGSLPPLGYSPTTAADQKSPCWWPTINGIKIKFTSTIDVPGTKEHYGVWCNAIKGADVLIYMFRVDKVHQESEIADRDRVYTSRCREDIKLIANKLRENGQLSDKGCECSVLLLGTHRDKDPNFDKEQSGNYFDMIKKVVFVDEAMDRLGAKSARLCLGSVNTVDGVNEVLQSLFGNENTP